MAARSSVFVPVWACLVLVGCAGLFRSADLAPSGLTRYDDDLRKLLAAGRADSALALVSPKHERVDDELLRLQYAGLAAHYAGRWEESNAALLRAADLTEERYTRSISRAALSLVASDRILPYRPPSTERLLFHYYVALNFLRLGDTEAAAVEARRLSHLLELDADRAPPEGGRRSLHAALRYLAGTVFEAAGERNDADVAYRVADRLAPARPGPTDRLELPDGAERAGELPADSGDIVLVVERGFVAHRVSRSLNVLLWPEEVRTLRASGGRDQETERLESATELATRLLAERRRGADLSERHPARTVDERGADGGSGGPTNPEPIPGMPGTAGPPTGTSGDSAAPSGWSGPAAGRLRGVRPARAGRARQGTPYLLRVAWPELADGRAFASPPRARLDGQVSREASLRSDLSTALAADFAEQQPLILAKSLLRALAKYSLTRAVKKELKEEDEVLGEVAGLAANAALTLLEQADTRCWHLLPAELSVVRLRAPAGRQSVTVELPGEPGRAGRPLTLEAVEVRPGGVAVLSVRDWP